jgi:MFS transporter, OPA family, glycerol-3-phosphate transporter
MIKKKILIWSKKVLNIISWPFKKIFLLNFFPPAPHKKIEMSSNWKQKYSKLRYEILVLLILGYTGAYFVRSVLQVSSTDLINGGMFGSDEKLSIQFYGLLSTILLLSYAFGKFILANVSDRSNARYMLATPLIITAVLNIILGFLTYKLKWLMIIIVMLIGWFQGACWPACARIFSHWWINRERAKYMAIHSISHNIGAGLLASSFLLTGGIISFSIKWFSGLFNGLINSNAAHFILPSILTLIIAVIVLIFLKDTPQEVGLPSVEVFKGEVKLEKGDIKEKDWKEILLNVLKNPSLWILGLAQICIGIIRTLPLIWILNYLKSNLGIDTNIDKTHYALFEWSAIPGTILAGFLADYFFHKVKYFQNYRARFLFLISSPLLIIWILLVFLKSYFALAIIVFLWGFIIYGPYTITGSMGIEFASKKSGGSATGFMGFLSYFITAIYTGYIQAWLINNFGYNSFFISLIVCIIGLIICSLLLWNKKSYSHNEEEVKK